MNHDPVEVSFQSILDLTHAQRNRALEADVIAHATDLARRDQRIAELIDELEDAHETTADLTATVEQLQTRIRQLEADVDDLLEKKPGV